MKALAIETATTACAIGVLLDDGFVEERVLDRDRRHTEVLTAGIARVLLEHDLEVRDLDVIVVDRGPGLFTGLRVGIATAQSLANAVGIGLVGVTSLEVLAHRAYEAGVRGRFVGLVDGRRGEVFVQSFDLVDGSDAVDEPRVMTPADVVASWGATVEVTFGGDGATRYRDIFSGVKNVTIGDFDIPSPASALALGAHRRASDAVPALYLRDADAVANFTTREKRP